MGYEKGVRSYISEELKEELEQFCRDNEYSESSGIRFLLKLGLEAHRIQTTSLKRLIVEQGSDHRMTA